MLENMPVFRDCSVTVYSIAVRLVAHLVGPSLLLCASCALSKFEQKWRGLHKLTGSSTALHRSTIQVEGRGLFILTSTIVFMLLFVESYPTIDLLILSMYNSVALLLVFVSIFAF